MTVTPSDAPPLYRGSRDDDDRGWVHYLQDLLRAAGHDPGTSDGSFGSKTAAAVRDFESSHGIRSADGDVTSETWAWLIPYADQAYGQTADQTHETDERAESGKPGPAAEAGDGSAAHASIVGASFRIATLIQEDNLLWWQMENMGPGYVSAHELVDAVIVTREGERVTTQEFRNETTVHPGDVYGNSWTFADILRDYSTAEFDVELYVAMQPDEHRASPDVAGAVRVNHGEVKWI